MTGPFFSIVTPVYNGRHHISSYFKSLFSQYYHNWEAIIVDDHSTDDSLQLLTSYSSKDSRIKLISHCVYPSIDFKKGPHNPRNIGLNHSQGKYICFWDIDDFWFPNHLSSYYNYLVCNSHVLILYSNYYFSSTRKYPLTKRISVRNPIFFSKFLNPIPMLTSCIHTSLASAYRFPSHVHEDYLYWFSILSTINPESVAKLNYFTSIYNSSYHSLSSNKFKSTSYHLRCYHFIGYGYVKSILFLLVRFFVLFILFALPFLLPFSFSL